MWVSFPQAEGQNQGLTAPGEGVQGSGEEGWHQHSGRLFFGGRRGRRRQELTENQKHPVPPALGEMGLLGGNGWKQR